MGSLGKWAGVPVVSPHCHQPQPWGYPQHCCWAQGDPSLGSLVSPWHFCGHRGVWAQLGNSPNLGSPWATPPQGN